MTKPILNFILRQKICSFSNFIAKIHMLILQNILCVLYE